MLESVSLALSLCAVALSAITAWLTLFQRGTVLMTQPTAIFFSLDGPANSSEIPPPKVFLRSLLYSTSKRGRIVENMFVRLHRLESSQTFNIWAHGENSPTRSLTLGSGLYVGEAGVARDHHFTLPAGETAFTFLAGDYTLAVYASLVGDTQPLLLFTTHLTLSQQHADQIYQADMGILFNWGPDSRSYHAHLLQPRRPQAELSPLLLDFLRNPGRDASR
jgi:hypothetical protein